MPDSEIEAMTAVAEALSPLDQDSRQRVLRWALGRFETERAVGHSYGSPNTTRTSLFAGVLKVRSSRNSQR